MKMDVNCLEALTYEITEKLHLAVQQKDHATLAVSGGKTPIKLFQKLAKSAIAWQNVTIILVDERCVASESSDSNAHLVRRYLLQERAASATFIPLYDDMSIPSSLKNAPKITDIDVLILGMGDDGHTASLFPNHEKLPEAYNLQSTDFYIHITPQNTPYERISMRLKTILNAQYIFLHVEGKKKKEVLENALASGDIYKYPILSVLRQTLKNIKVYMI
ncbi:MAG: 6-phosphogluconolactonase [Sulfurospirillum sp.]|nr:6-phosphogluconolactonase [Sulfurospirillum sp.]